MGNLSKKILGTFQTKDFGLLRHLTVKTNVGNKQIVKIR